MSDKEWLGELLDTFEEELFFGECDEIFEEMLFAEVVFCRMCMFVDEEAGEWWEVVSIGIFWMSDFFLWIWLIWKNRLSGVGGECIGRHIMGIILLQ